LGDQIARIAKDPVRKLGPKDRLIGAGLMCLEQDVEPGHVAFAAAAGIRYDHPDDPAVRKLQKLVKDQGIRGVMRDVCAIDLGGPLAERIEEGNQRLERDGWLQ